MCWLRCFTSRNLVFKSIWQKNSFPLFFIDNCIKKFLDKLFIKQNLSGAVSKKKKVFICLELLGKMSLQSEKQLIEIFRTRQKNNSILNAFRFKDQMPKYMSSEKNLKYTQKDATTIRKHCRNFAHTADTSCFSLVGNAAIKYHLKLKESLLILKMKPSLNVAKESMLSQIFEIDS